LKKLAAKKHKKHKLEEIKQAEDHDGGNEALIVFILSQFLLFVTLVLFCGQSFLGYLRCPTSAMA
jgi:hypothetical protein